MFFHPWLWRCTPKNSFYLYSLSFLYLFSHMIHIRVSNWFSNYCFWKWGWCHTVRFSMTMWKTDKIKSCIYTLITGPIKNLMMPKCPDIKIRLTFLHWRLQHNAVVELLSWWSNKKLAFEKRNSKHTLRTSMEGFLASYTLPLWDRA